MYAANRLTLQGRRTVDITFDERSDSCVQRRSVAVGMLTFMALWAFRLDSSIRDRTVRIPNGRLRFWRF